MSTLNIILLSLSLFQIISLDENSIYVEDAAKCNWPNSINNNSTEKCISITPSLESTGSFKGKCCRVTRIYNPLYAYKKLYGDDWKKIVCKANKLDTNLTENEILNKLTFKKSSFCTHFINNEINMQLYSLLYRNC